MMALETGKKDKNVVTCVKRQMSGTDSKCCRRLKIEMEDFRKRKIEFYEIVERMQSILPQCRFP